MDQGRGAVAAEKWNPKRSPVNTLINSWQEYAKYYRTLILTRCSSLTRLIKHRVVLSAPREKAHMSKATPPYSTTPSHFQDDANLWPLGMMHFPLLVVCQGVGKVVTGKRATKQGIWKAQTYTDLVGNLILTKSFVWKEAGKNTICQCAESVVKSQAGNQIFTPFWLIQKRKGKKHLKKNPNFLI